MPRGLSVDGGAERRHSCSGSSPSTLTLLFAALLAGVAAVTLVQTLLL